MSEKSLDKLIASLKSEAITAAENESDKILEEARMEAQKILEDAKKKSDQMLVDAEQEAQATIRKGESALQQAARDLNITLRNDILSLFGSVLEQEIHKQFTPDLLKSAVVPLIQNIGSDVELSLPADFKEELASYIHKQLKESDIQTLIKEGSTLSRLTITQKEQGWSYDISPDEIAQLLKSHLIGKWTDILKKEANQ